MIGNDVVDFNLAQSESNWKRKGYLEKIFSKTEINYILKSKKQAEKVWELWSRKEATYKIHNRFTGEVGFYPKKIRCLVLKSKKSGLIEVQVKNEIYYTFSETTKNYIHSIAVKNKNDFFKIYTIPRSNLCLKTNHLPFYKSKKNPISISNHGNYEAIVGLKL
jgi:phosphopantetheinyl transferase (holo-ACP synthase)